MEIIDYLKLARRRLWIMVAVPLLAVGGVFVYHYAGPASYQASAYVSMPTVLNGSNNQFTGPAGATSWANAFSATATSPLVTKPVAKKTNVPIGAIANGLQVTQVQQSAQLQVAFTWTNRATANAVVRRVAAQTPKALFAPQVTQAEQAATQAQQSLLSINKQILASSADTGSLNPFKLYYPEVAVLAHLKLQQAAAEAKGDSAALEAAKAKIATASSELATLGTQVARYQNLVAERQAAAGVLTTAQQNLQAVKTQYAGATAVHAVTMLPVTSAGLRSFLLKGALPAAIAALLLAFCLVAALEMIGAGRRETEPSTLEATSALRPFPVSSNYRDGYRLRPRLARSPLGALLPSSTSSTNGALESGPLTVSETSTSEKGTKTSGRPRRPQAAAATRR